MEDEPQPTKPRSGVRDHPSPPNKKDIHVPSASTRLCTHPFFHPFFLVHPPRHLAAELLDATDRLGFMVWDENRFFGDFPTWYTDMADMIKRDRNHPSIIWWSLCNGMAFDMEYSVNFDTVCGVVVIVIIMVRATITRIQ